MSEVKNSASGVVGVLTHGNDYILAPLNETDVANDPNRTERIAQPRGNEAEWFALKRDILGFPGGRVKLPNGTKIASEKLLRTEAAREIADELRLELALDQLRGDIMAVGVVEQIRRGKFAAFLVYALLGIELTDQQAQFLGQQGAVKFSLAGLEENFQKPDFIASVRPASLLVIRRALLGSRNF